MHMKGFIRGLTIAALFAGAADVARAQGVVKIGFIQSQRLLQEVPGRSEAEEQFKKEASGIQTELQRMEDSLKTMATAYQSEAPKLDSARRVARERALGEIEAAFEARARAL